MTRSFRGNIDPRRNEGLRLVSLSSSEKAPPLRQTLRHPPFINITIKRTRVADATTKRQKERRRRKEKRRDRATSRGIYRRKNFQFRDRYAFQRGGENRGKFHR